MQNRTKFFLALIPAVLMAVVAEATIPSLIAKLAMWVIGSSTGFGIFLAVAFWVATFVAILATSILAGMAVGVEMGVIIPQGNRNVPPMQNIAPVHPIRRGPN